MKDQNILSWNVANFISVILMIAILWALLGALGHIAVRAPAMKKAGADKRTASAVREPAYA